MGMTRNQSSDASPDPVLCMESMGTLVLLRLRSCVHLSLRICCSVLRISSLLIAAHFTLNSNRDVFASVRSHFFSACAGLQLVGLKNAGVSSRIGKVFS